MKRIFVLGAGRSSASLVAYLLDNAAARDWHVIVGDADGNAAAARVGNHDRGRAVRFDVNDPADISMIDQADVVISLLPPPFHPAVARRCLQARRHLVTASYVSAEMRALDAEAQRQGLVFLNECGLDPGIDHMTAMQVIDRIRSSGGTVVSFESFTGGLIAPETDPGNPWRYKFTWNPRNVVMAGQGTAKYLENGKFRYIPYQQLFRRTTSIHVPGLGDFEGYANRDSLGYISTYGLHGIRTMLRGTLRNRGFCPAWNVFVQLGCCDDSYLMDGVQSMTHAEFLASFLPGPDSLTVEAKIRGDGSLCTFGHEADFLKWSGFFSDEPVGLPEGTPARILEHILNKKWKLNERDRDQIVMFHRFIFELDGKQREIRATLVATGTDSVYTAMARTVGLPLGIAAKLILEGKIDRYGVVIPTFAGIYEPVLKELADYGIALTENEVG